MITAKCTYAAVIPIMPVCQINSCAPSDLPGDITQRRQRSCGYTYHRREVYALLHQIIKHTERIKALPTSAFQY